MSSKINLQTCEYARKSSIFQDNQLIYDKFYAITADFWRIFKFSANSCDKKHLNYDKFTVRFYVLSCQKFFMMIQ